LTLNGRPLTAEVGRDDTLVFEDAGKDIDLYAVEIPTSGVYAFSTGIGLDFSAQTVIRLFDETGRLLIESSANATTGNVLAVNIVVESPTRLFVGVTGLGQSAATYDPVTGQFANNAGASLGQYSIIVKEFAMRPSATITFRRLPLPPPLAPVAPAPLLRGEVTGLVMAQRVGERRVGRRLRQTWRLTNTSGQAISGPLAFVLSGLSRRRARLRQATGFTTAASGSNPFLNVPLPGSVLGVGESATVILDLVLRGPGRPRYAVRLLAGGV
jgi:hypothetical protein